MLALVGSRVPVQIKVLLTALAIIDDLGAIVIIALFYGSELSLPMLGGAALVLAALIALNRCGVMRLAVYIPLGLLLWFLVLQVRHARHRCGRAVRLDRPAEAVARPSRRRALAAASS